EAELRLAAQIAGAVVAVVGERVLVLVEVAGHDVGALDLDLIVDDAHVDLVADRRTAGLRAFPGRRAGGRVGDERLDLGRAVALIERDPALVGGVDQWAWVEVERREPGLAQR